MSLQLSGCGGSSDSDTPEDRPSVFTRINENVQQHFEGYQQLKASTETIGHRLTGSANGEKAEQLAHDLLESYGYDSLYFSDFRVRAWSRDSLSLTVRTGKEDWQSMSAVALAHSPEEVSVRLPVVDVGSGLSGDFARLGDAVKGKIVMANLGLLPADSAEKNLHRSEKAALAEKAGAAGLVLIHADSGRILLTGTASVTGDLIGIPAICITHEDGAQLRARMAAGESVEMDIRMRNYAKEISARNVVAVLPGTELPEERIVIGGHLDSWDLSHGAIDNGIGSFTVIDIARTFKALNIKPKRSIYFVLFMGEEQGLLGSTHLVEEWVESKEIDEVCYMLNLDMTGNPIGIGLAGREEMTDWAEALVADIRGVDTAFTGNLDYRAGLHSDHQPFMLQGIPVMGFRSNLDPAVYRYYHSDGDDFHLVDEAHMRNTSRFVAMALYALANADSIPAKRLNENEIRDFLRAHDLEEKLRLHNEWRWD